MVGGGACRAEEKQQFLVRSSPFSSAFLRRQAAPARAARILPEIKARECKYPKWSVGRSTSRSRAPEEELEPRSNGHEGSLRDGRPGRSNRSDAGPQNLSRAALGGFLRGLPPHRPEEPQGHSYGFPAAVRHDHFPWENRIHRQQEEA